MTAEWDRYVRSIELVLRYAGTPEIAYLMQKMVVAKDLTGLRHLRLALEEIAFRREWRHLIKQYEAASRQSRRR